MRNILIKPRNEEEYIFINQFLQKTRLKSSIITDEDLNDLKVFDKAINKVKNGKATFYKLDEVKKKLSMQ